MEKLHDKVIAHEKSNDHKMGYLTWKQLEQKIKEDTGGQTFECMLVNEYNSEKKQMEGNSEKDSRCCILSW